MGQFMGVAGVKAWNLVPIFRGKCLAVTNIAKHQKDNETGVTVFI